jgi:hypothetical protein
VGVTAAEVVAVRDCAIGNKVVVLVLVVVVALAAVTVDGLSGWSELAPIGGVVGKLWRLSTGWLAGDELAIKVIVSSPVAFSSCSLSSSSMILLTRSLLASGAPVDSS